MLHTIPKVGFERRELKIPNHLQQGRLVQITEQYFEEIKRTYDKSVISLSKPTPSENDEERAVTNIGYGEFKERCALASYHKQFQLQMDISKFYHSIYTHSIAWTTEGKLSYKKNRARPRYAYAFFFRVCANFFGTVFKVQADFEPNFGRLKSAFCTRLDHGLKSFAAPWRLHPQRRPTQLSGGIPCAKNAQN